MPVYKDEKKNTWYAKFRYKDWTGTTKYKTKRGFATKREASEWEASFKSRNAGELDMKLKDFAKIYMEERFPRLKEVTRREKEYIFNDKIIPRFGELPLNEITSKDVIKWQNELLAYRDPDGKPYSSSYLKTLHNQLSALFNYAMRHYALPLNPAAIAGNVGSDKNIKTNFWTTEEYKRFSEEVMDEPPYYYYFQVLYWLGIREGEGFALMKSDFDFDKKEVKITKTYQPTNKLAKITLPKSDKSYRTIALPGFLCEEMQEYFDLLPDDIPDGRIFYMLSKTMVTRKLNQKAKALGLKHIRVHDLRHSHVSLLINLGYSAVAIADRLGHESVHVTYRYAHLFPNVQSDMAKRLDELNNHTIGGDQNVGEST